MNDSGRSTFTCPDILQPSPISLGINIPLYELVSSVGNWLSLVLKNSADIVLPVELITLRLTTLLVELAGVPDCTG